MPLVAPIIPELCSVWSVCVCVCVRMFSRDRSSTHTHTQLHW